MEKSDSLSNQQNANCKVSLQKSLRRPLEPRYLIGFKQKSSGLGLVKK